MHPCSVGMRKAISAETMESDRYFAGCVGWQMLKRVEIVAVCQTVFADKPAPTGGAGVHEKAPQGVSRAGLGVQPKNAYRPAAARKASTRSVFSQVNVVKVSSPTVFTSGVRPKWP
ncbi:hypothetical protein PS723_05999 [Pseudomonas fluorescens]|uniref:Uncharacterized protein n=1 Tax=Pseudomonas fluorescens TaxID=294 RepID=A0A5E7FVI3_PSEFL|nr:hypothetical protein PS723_05999 [Pseudomonas fluorescens]